jgi:hypothetical protein
MFRPIRTLRALPAILALTTILATPALGQGPGTGGGPVRPGPKLPVGLAAGMSTWPESRYCDGPATASMQPLAPREVLGTLELASRCGFRLVIVPPRRFLTTSGRVKGGFSLDNAKHLMDLYAAQLPPDTLRKYRDNILGFNLGDDYGDKKSWGGEKISQEQVAAWATYARTKLPGVALGVRVTPDWVEKYPPLAPLIDYAWAQYHGGKGDAAEYYNKAARIADRLGLRLIMGVNVERCYGASSSPCSGHDLVRYGNLAVNHSATCAFLNWKYDAATWDDPEVRAAWGQLLAVAKGKKAQDCRRLKAGSS